MAETMRWTPGGGSIVECLTKRLAPGDTLNAGHPGDRISPRSQISLAQKFFP